MEKDRSDSADEGQGTNAKCDQQEDLTQILVFGQFALLFKVLFRWIVRPP